MEAAENVTAHEIALHEVSSKRLYVLVLTCLTVLGVVFSGMISEISLHWNPGGGFAWLYLVVLFVSGWGADFLEDEDSP